MQTQAPVNPQRIMQYAFGFVPSMAVSAAVELGVFDAIAAGHRDTTAIATALSANPRGIQPLLHTLSALGLIEREGQSYALPADSQAFLVSQSPAYLGGMMNHQSRHIGHWARLAEAVRAGRSSRPVEGDEDDGKFFAGFVAALFNMGWPAAQAAAAELGAAPRQALDVGCGSAVWSLALAQQVPELHTVAVDRQLVLDEVTRAYVSRFGYQDRYQLRAGNFREVELEENRYDVAFLGQILHSEGEEASRRLLERLQRALVPGGTLVVAEMVASDPREEELFPNLFDLNMLLWTEQGTVFDRARLEEMARSAGFSATRWLPVPGPSPLLLATK